jgi:DNA-binding response OmpR family regulator
MDKVRVLLADDDCLLGEILTEELAHCGFEVAFAKDGQAAIECMKQKEFDVAIVDIRMPKIDGYGVLQYIRQEKQKMKVIILSAYADLRHSVTSIENGADEFLSKPYDLEIMRHTIEQLSKN